MVFCFFFYFLFFIFYKVNRAYVVIARNNFPCPLLNMRPIETHSTAEDVSFFDLDMDVFLVSTTRAVQSNIFKYFKKE